MDEEGSQWSPMLRSTAGALALGQALPHLPRLTQLTLRQHKALHGHSDRWRDNSMLPAVCRLLSNVSSVLSTTPHPLKFEVRRAESATKLCMPAAVRICRGAEDSADGYADSSVTPFSSFRRRLFFMQS